MSRRSRADARAPITRTQLERLIEEAIEALDLLDGDTDLEPSLAGSYNSAHVYDVEGDSADDEPSLGSYDGMLNQENWSRAAGPHAYAAMTDAELDNCELEDGGDDEPDSDDELTGDEKEPSLGSLDAQVDQAVAWASVDADDCELDPTEHRGEPHLSSDADVAAAREASKQLRAIAARQPGLATKRPKSRSHTSICNIGPMYPVVCL